MFRPPVRCGQVFGVSGDVLHHAQTLAEFGVGHGTINLITAKRDIAAGEHHALGLALRIESDVHADAPCGKGGFQRLHAAAGLQYLGNGVVDAVFDSGLAFQAVAVHLLLALAESKAVFPRKGLGDACRLAETLVARDGVAVVINPVIGDMHMGVRLVVMTGHDELGVHDTHAPQVFLGYVGHQRVRQLGRVLRCETQRDMPDEILQGRAAFGLQAEARHNGLVRCQVHALGSDDVRILVLDVVGVIHQPGETLSAAYLCHHGL